MYNKSKRINMKQLIGFATEFYTLWSYEENPVYRTDSYGNHHQVGVNHIFNYIKNISKDIDKVKSLYPNIEINEDLRGKTRSFSYDSKIELPDNYFWYGKYTGKLIDEILEKDFQYCLWFADNNIGKAQEYIKNHPIYIFYFEAIEKEKQEMINSKQLLNVGDKVELEFTRNGYNANEEYTECFTSAIYNDVEVTIKCKGVKYVGGKYPYLMPIINGKAQKTKGKKITVTISDVLNTTVSENIVKQYIEIL